MPRFDAQWMEPAAAGRGARLRQARVQAPQAQAVAAALGITPGQLVSVRPLTQPVGSAAWPRRSRLDLRLFSQELAVLLQAGIPLLEALATLREKDGDGRAAAPDQAHQADPVGPAHALRPAAPPFGPPAGPPAGPLDAVMAALREGHSISAALARSPQAFDELFIALVAASERSGQLATTLQDHAAYLAWSGALASRLRAALVYPLMLLAAGAAVVMFLLLYVLPRFAGVFDGLGRDLPIASRWLIDLGVLAAADPALSVGLALALPLGGWLASRLPATRRLALAGLWRSPLGPHLRRVALARLYRALGLTLAAGIPVPQALALVAGLLPAHLRPALQQVLAGVRSGQRLSVCLNAHGLATPVAWRMLRVGESSGELSAMFGRAAAFHDEQIARLSDLVTRVVNPVLMLVMGVVIGGIVVLMYLPIFTLMEQVQ